MKNKFNLIAGFIVSAILFLVILTGWFYWYQWKPSEIRKECNTTAIETEEAHKHLRLISLRGLSEDREPSIWIDEGYDYDSVYKRCLRENGLR